MSTSSDLFCFSCPVNFIFLTQKCMRLFPELTEALTSLALLNEWFIDLRDEVADSHFALQAALCLRVNSLCV